MSDKIPWDKVLKPDYTNVRRRIREYRCRDGHLVKSRMEMRIDNYLFSNNVVHELYPKLPGTRFIADWKVGDTYIEYWGGMGRKSYDDEKKRKIKYYTKKDLSLIQINRNDNITLKLSPLLINAPPLDLDAYHEVITNSPEIQAIDVSIDKREKQIKILEEEIEELTIKRNQIINKLISATVKRNK